MKVMVRYSIQSMEMLKFKKWMADDKKVKNNVSVLPKALIHLSLSSESLAFYENKNMS